MHLKYTFQSDPSKGHLLMKHIQWLEDEGFRFRVEGAEIEEGVFWTKVRVLWINSNAIPHIKKNLSDLGLEAQISGEKTQ